MICRVLVSIRIFEYFRGRIFESTFFQQIPALLIAVILIHVSSHMSHHRFLLHISSLYCWSAFRSRYYRQISNFSVI